MQLFSDPAVLKAEVMSNKLQLEDSLRYFRNHVERLGAVDYLPSDLDVAYVRIRTRGVHNLSFDINGTQFMCVDDGGQRNERRKWISQFDNVDAVMFVASLAAYDMTLIEERTKNRAEEALEPPARSWRRAQETSRTQGARTSTCRRPQEAAPPQPSLRGSNGRRHRSSFCEKGQTAASGGA